MDLYIGLLKINIFFKIDSISEKRAIIKKLRELANQRFNTSFLELETYDDFSNINIAFVNASSNKELITSVFNNIISYIKQIQDLILLKEFIKIDKHN